MFHSVRARLTLWYAAVLAVVLIAFSCISYLLIARQIRENNDAALVDSSREFTAAFQGEEETREVLLDFRYSDREILVFSPDRRIIASSRARTLTAAARLALSRLITPRTTGFLTIDGGEENDGFRAYAAPVSVLGQQYTVVVTRSLHEQADRLESAALSLFLGIPVALLIAAGGGYLLARKSLTPVLEMSRKAQQIGAATLSERITVRNDKDELGVLATTLNSLLSRLEDSFALQRRFMADASHELRTPLSILQGETDVILSREHRTEEEYRESLQIVQRSARKLTRIVQNLFMLARTDTGRYPIRLSRFYLDELVASCIQSVRTLAEVRGVEVTLAVGEEMLITADEDLLHQLVLNMLDNALKYGRGGGKVSVALRSLDDGYELSVSDDGPGVPPAEAERIFDRFHRLDRGRVASGEVGSGAGLGLAIARWIARVHGGDLRLARSDSSGSTFVATVLRQTEPTDGNADR